ncbi:type II secretion system protein [Oceanobacillus kapialis]
MRNNKGFTLVEVLTAITILTTVVITIMPLFQLLATESKILKERRDVNQQIFENLQPFLWAKDHPLPYHYQETVQTLNISYRFTREDELIKGCADWRNFRNETETICLYGIPEKR